MCYHSLNFIQLEFNERLLSDIVEESFEQGLSTDAVHSKFSTPKQITYHQIEKETDKDEEPMNQTEEMTSYNSLNKQYTKHCTEECTKQGKITLLKYTKVFSNKNLEPYIELI